ncbi:MAG: TrkH family potassium uptake protein [Rhodospirillales bacterium]
MLLYQPVLFIIGVLVMVLGLVMAIPAAVDVVIGSDSAAAFGISAVITFGLGSIVALANRVEIDILRIRQAFLVTSGSWLAFSLVSTLPFIFAAPHLSFIDALFETVSGLTTTGSTVLVKLDTMDRGILLWRAMLQWIGGIGIIVTAIIMLPYLKIGGMQIFQMESSDRSEKIFPRAKVIAMSLGAVYLSLSLMCALLYWLEGMSGFEAVTHAMTTVSTGGYSTSDASLGHFQSPAIQWTAILFMLAGAVPFLMYLRLVTGNPREFLQNRQIRSLLLLLLITITVLTVWLILSENVAPGEALRLAAFNIVSVVTTTGFATADYYVWGTLPIVLFFVLTFLGGCTGSTSGAIKIFRFEIALIVTKNTIFKSLNPHGVQPLRYQGRPVTNEVIRSVVVFIFTFVLITGLLTVALGMTGLDFITAASGAATAMANVGPGLGPVIGPAGNFAPLPDSAKILLVIGMLLGRLEIFTILVLLTPRFWRG